MQAKLVVLITCAFLLSGLRGQAVAQSAASAEEQVLAVLNDLIRSHVARDRATASRYYHENLSYGHNNGQIDSKEHALEDLQSGMWVAAKMLDAKVEITGQVAVVRSTMNYGKDCSQPGPMCGARVLWILIQERGSWQVLARQAVGSFNNPTVLCCAHAAAAKASKQK